MTLAFLHYQHTTILQERLDVLFVRTSWFRVCVLKCQIPYCHDSL